MDDGLVTVLLEMVQPVTAFLCGLTVVGIKCILNKLRDFDRRFDEQRREVQELLKEYQRKETCHSNRLYITHMIDDMRQEVRDLRSQVEKINAHADHDPREQ